MRLEFLVRFSIALLFCTFRSGFPYFVCLEFYVNGLLFPVRWRQIWLPPFVHPSLCRLFLYFSVYFRPDVFYFIYNTCVLRPVYTIPFSFHIVLGKAIRYENFSCLHDAVFISYRIGFMPLSECFRLKTRKR